MNDLGDKVYNIKTDQGNPELAQKRTTRTYRASQSTYWKIRWIIIKTRKDWTRIWE